MSNHIEYIVTSGTGRFLNGSGSIVGDGTLDFRNGAARADLARDGTLSLPAVLRQVDRLDAAVVADDGAAFQAALADDLMVNTRHRTRYRCGHAPSGATLRARSATRATTAP